MAISSQTTFVSYTGNASTVTPYPVTFRYDEAAWVTVEEIEADGTITPLSLGPDFTLGGNGSTTTGTVTTTGRAIPGTSTLRISRDTALTQTVSLAVNGVLPSSVIEAEFDKITMAQLDQKRRQSAGDARSLRLPDGELAAPLPAASLRAGEVLFFNASTGAVETKTPDEILALSGGAPDGIGLPSGGTTGQSLTKSSGTDYAVAWTDTVTAATVIPVLTANAASARAAISAPSIAGAGIVDPAAFRSVLDLTPFQRSGGAAAIHAALKANRSCGIAVVGDSTGNGTDEWVYLLGQHIAAQAPGHKVVHRVWSGSAWTSTTIQDPGNGERRYNHPASGGLSGYFGAADLVHVGPDLVIEAKITAASWAAVTGKIIAQQWGSIPNRNWKLSMGTGTINLQWYENDGTTFRFPAGSSAIPFVDGSPMWVRVFLDVDNGASQYAVTHYYSTNGVTWTAAGTTTGATGVTTVNAGTFPVEILASAFTNGGISQLRVRSSLAGPTENHLAIDNAVRGALSNDELSLSGDPLLQIDNMSVSGWTVANATQAQINNLDHHGTLLAFISLSHNEGFAGGLSGRDWTNGIKAIADMIEARCPMAQIVLVGQNPEAVFGTFDQHQIDQHALRIAQLAALAAKEGYGFLNFFQAFHDSGSAILDLVPDGIHPAGAGTTLMVDTASDGYDQARF